MRAKILQELEKRINDHLSIRADTFMETHPYAGTDAVIRWLIGVFKAKLNATTRLSDFDVAIAGRIEGLLTEGDKFYQALFLRGKFINKHTKEQESKTPYTDAVRKIYHHLSSGQHGNDDGLAIYSALRALLQRALGKQLACDPDLQTYEQWIAMGKLLEVEYEISKEWLDHLSLTRLRAEQAKFLSAKRTRRLADIASLDFSYRDREKAAKSYTAQLRKLPKTSAFGYVEAAIKSADLIHFTRTTSLQKRLAKKMGIREFVTFIDYLKFPIAQYHAFFFIQELDDYVQIIRDLCSRMPRKTSKDYLLIYTLKNYFDFVNRTLTDLESFQNRYTYQKNRKGLKEVRLVQREAQALLKDWKDHRIKESFEAILTAIFPKSNLSSSKFFVATFEWLNSYSKLHLTHSGATSRRELIDLLNESFQLRLDADRVSYHALADQLAQGSINQEGLKKLVAVLNTHPEDTDFLDKLYSNYLVHMNAADFRWHAEGNVDTEEAINQAYYFSQVMCAYADADQRWHRLFISNRIRHEGWMPTVYAIVSHQRESYLLCVGIGMAHFLYSQKNTTQAAATLFKIVEILLKQIRSSYDRISIDYETPLWFAGATMGRYAHAERDRFVSLICQQVDSLKLFLRVIYEFLAHSKTTALSATSRTRIQERLQAEFFIIASSKVDADLKHDLDYYQKLKQFVENKLLGGLPGLT